MGPLRMGSRLMNIASKVAAIDPKKVLKPSAKSGNFTTTMEVYWEDENDQEITYLVDAGVYQSGGSRPEVELWNFRIQDGFVPVDEDEFWTKFNKDRVEQKAIDAAMEYYEDVEDLDLHRRHPKY